MDSEHHALKRIFFYMYPCDFNQAPDIDIVILKISYHNVSKIKFSSYYYSTYCGNTTTVHIVVILLQYIWW